MLPTAMPRLTLLALTTAVLALTGCGFRVPSDPAHPAATVTVFNDGFHSGFIVPYDDLPFELSTAEGKKPPFVEVGFSEWKWGMNFDRTNSHALRLVFWPSPGVVMVSYLADERRNADTLVPRIAFAIPLDAAQKQAFYDELLAWIDPRKPALYTTSGERPTHFLASTHSYMLQSNCHDFTAHMLRVIGIPVPRTLARTPARFTRELKLMVFEAREAGWPIVSMTPRIVHVEATP